MYYSRTLRSRRIERALACLAGIVLLTHALVAHESEQPAATAQTNPTRIPAFPELVEHQDVVTADGHRIDVRLLVGPSGSASDRIRTTAQASLERLIAWFGPLPSPRLTIVNAPWSGRASCGSSPGLVVVSSRWLQPEQDFSLERALIAGLARQPFSSFAADDSTGGAFVEGLGRFAAVRAINDTLAVRHILSVRHFGGFVPYQIRAIALARQRSDPRPFVHQFDELALPGCASAEGRVAASDERVHETTIALLSLERSIGWPALQQAMATLVERFRGRTPQPSDLMAIVADQRGGAPAPIFARALSGRTSIDGAIAAFTSEPGDERGAFRTIVRARFEPGAGTGPPDGQAVATRASAVPLTIRFADGETVSEWLDDVQRADVTLEYDSPSPAVEASIDRDATLLFDRDRANNTRVRSPRLPLTAVRRLLNWLVWLQDLALTGTALV